MSFAIYGEANDMELAATTCGKALLGPNAPVSPWYPLSGTIWGPRTSPAKRVVWGEDEQRSERGLPLAAG